MEKKQPEAEPNAAPEQPLLEHLVELRRRILRSLFSVLLLFFPLYWFANELYALTASPLTSLLPEGSVMIATEVTSPFLTPFKLTVATAVLLAMPYILHQAWSFVSPGLYQHEKRIAIPLLISSTLLFYLGILFAYAVALPLIFRFTTSVVPEGVEIMTDISRYLDFILTLFFAFGIAFEIPVATYLLTRAGLTSPAGLRKKRPYVVIGCFAAGMVVTPPDAISQILLAIPMWLLFEAGLLLSQWSVKET